MTQKVPATMALMKQQFAGAVERRREDKDLESISASDFGTDPSGVLDSSADLQEAFDAAAGKKLLLAPGAIYRCSQQLHIKGDVDGQGATLLFYGAALQYLVFQNGHGSLKNFTIDGTNVPSCTAGLFVDTDFVQTKFNDYDLRIVNIGNTDNTQSCSGAVFFKGAGAVNLNSLLNIRIQVTGVVATSNGTVGDNGGKASGILVGFNAAGTNGVVIVRESVVDNVSSGGANPFEDSDCFHMAIAGDTVAPVRGLVHVVNCIAKNIKKRGFKIQAGNALVENCVCFGQTAQAGFETYSLNTTFRDCKHLQGTGAAFTTSWKNTHFVNCVAEGSDALVDLVSIYNNADFASIEGCTFSSSAPYATGDHGILRIYDADNVRLSASSLLHSSSQGCGILIRDQATVNIDNCLLKGSLTGINLWQSSGRVVISDSEIYAANQCMSRQGSTTQAVYARDCRFESGSLTVLDLYNSSGANSTYGEIDTCVVISNGGGGIWMAPGSRLTNSRLENMGALAGNGVYIPGDAALGCQVRNNRFSNFVTGVLSPFGINQEVADNVTIGCTTPYDLGGATPLVNVDNFSR